MADKRQYEPWTVFNARIVDLRHLWEPSREFKGKPTEKPNWFSAFIVPKTVGNWMQEPALAGITEACRKIWNNAQHVSRWPVSDGDLPNAEGKQSDWAKGHWVFGGSTGNAPNVELAQPGGTLVKLTNKATMLPGGATMQVKAGDFVVVGGTCAIAQNEANRVKSYLNAVVFSAPGTEIVFAGQVTGAELMRSAQAQGMPVAGYAAPAGGFGGAPQGAPGFGAPATFPGATAPAQPGFAPQTGPGFTAPTQGGPATAFPSNGAPQQLPPNPAFAPQQQYAQPQPSFGAAPVHPGAAGGGFGAPAPGPAFGQPQPGWPAQ